MRPDQPLKDYKLPEKRQKNVTYHSKKKNYEVPRPPPPLRS